LFAREEGGGGGYHQPSAAAGAAGEAAGTVSGPRPDGDGSCISPIKHPEVTRTFVRVDGLGHDLISPPYPSDAYASRYR